MPNMDDDLIEEVEDTEETPDQDVEEEEDVTEEEDADAGGDEPEDLAAALRAVQQADKAAAADPLEGAQGSDGDGDGEGEPEGEADDFEGSEDLPDDESDEDAGGPGAPYGEPDYQSAGKQLLSQVTQYAIDAATKEFRDKNIREMSMSDIFERTQDGRVVYHNPDDRSRPFSSRMEAQAWLDSFNGQVRSELVKRAKAIRNGMARQIEPTMNLLRFAPSYDAMSQEEQEIFDDLVSGYEIRNDKSKVIGYSCDLDRSAKKAKAIAAKYASRKAKSAPTAKKEAGPQRKPSIDMGSHGTPRSSKVSSNEEPETIEEAMKIYMREHRKGNM